MKIYLATSLTHVPRSNFHVYVSLIHEFANKLKMGGHNVEYALINSDPQLADKPFNDRARLCYLWDKEMVGHADVVVAESTYPSTGQGIELQIAQGLSKPIILCFNSSSTYQAEHIEYKNPDGTKHELQIGEGHISLMALGLPSVFKVINYNNIEDLSDKTLLALKLLENDITCCA